MTEDREKETLYCRRLGHDVPFGYCLREGGDRPCRLVFDCWWERFDVQTFLRDRLPGEIYRQMEASTAPPNKVLSLVEMIEQARQRRHEDRPSDASEPSPRDPEEENR